MFKVLKKSHGWVFFWWNFLHRGVQVVDSDALHMQMEVQKRLHEQLEVSFLSWSLELQVRAPLALTLY
jgi:hypothetical protein